MDKLTGKFQMALADAQNLTVAGDHQYIDAGPEQCSETALPHNNKVNSG